MSGFLSVTYIIVCVLLIVLILLQPAKSGGMGAIGGGGGGGGNTVFGARCRRFSRKADRMARCRLHGSQPDTCGHVDRSFWSQGRAHCGGIYRRS